MQYLKYLLKGAVEEQSLKNRDIEAGAKTIAADLELPGGRRKKLARVVAEHLEWFDAAEARGMTWDDMIAVLAAAGVKRANGLPLSRGALSSAVWRKRQEARAATPQNPGPTNVPTREVVGKNPSPRSRRTSPEREMAQSGKRVRSSTKDAVRRNATPEDRPTDARRHAKEIGPSNPVLAYMQRAARMRRNADDAD